MMNKQSFAISAIIAMVQASDVPEQGGKPFVLDDNLLAYPGDNCCHFWDRHLWEDSAEVTLCHDPSETQSEFDLHDYNMNDKVSSYWCGKNIAYDLCRNYPGSNCDGGNGSRGAGNIRSSWIAKDNSLTSVYLSKYDPVEKPAVTIFTDDNCKGRFGRFYGPTEIGVTQDYVKDDIHVKNVGNNTASSMMIPYGVTVELYSGYKFEDLPLTIVGGHYNDTRDQMACINLPDFKYNDKLSSMKIYKTGGMAEGYWYELSDSENGVFDVEFGFKSINDDITEVEQKITFQKSLSDGMTFNGQGISDSYANRMKQTTMTALAYETNKYMTIDCSPQQGANGVSLWQWVAASNDEENEVYTELTVCASSDKKPACPFSACLKGDCSVCANDWKA